MFRLSADSLAWLLLGALAVERSFGSYGTTHKRPCPSTLPEQRKRFLRVPLSHREQGSPMEVFHKRDDFPQKRRDNPIDSAATPTSICLSISHSSGRGESMAPRLSVE
jgi:hypothetical protein